MGRGSEVGQVLLDDKRVNAISFTGPVATGQRIAQACVARMAKFFMPPVLESLASGPRNR